MLAVTVIYKNGIQKKSFKLTAAESLTDVDRVSLNNCERSTVCLQVERNKQTKIVL